MRITQHPLLEFKRGRKIYFTFDGKIIPAYEGESIAAALHAVGIKVLKRSILHSRPRGFFCAIGKCASCMMTVNGVPNVKTCVTLVEDGLEVRSQVGKGRLEARENPHSAPIKKLNTQIAIVGAGPAGLTAAVTAQKYGASVLVIDENPHAGGQLVKQTHKFFGSSRERAGTRGTQIAALLGKEARDTIMLQAAVLGYYSDELSHSTTIPEGSSHLLALMKEGQFIELTAEKVIVATGASERMLLFENNDLPGVYGAGAVQTLMNVYGIRPGKRVLMVGAGNVGLIVSYQLLQAGVEVAAVVEALPHIGGYHVHAAKIRRCGVPIYTSTSIKGARGEDCVTGAVTVSLDENWNPIPGTEREFEVDVICLAVGLSPSVELFHQAGCALVYVPELGGHVPLHDAELETTIKGVYAAGDAAGIGEANTAMIEGKIAALSCLESLGLLTGEAEQERDRAFEELTMLRSGPFGERPRQGKERVFALMEELYARK
ncbi:MAG: FAD-dependent oxidoreductase [Theionarchaea archaeon]|nr:FAD-dependent oxidoreductase [Theionarchaea archaeon]